eukprot:9230464-Pyramimonas_sp.AAC.1
MISTFEGFVAILKAKKDGVDFPLAAFGEDGDGKKKKKNKDEKKEKKTRAPSAYNLFMKSVADQVKAKCKVWVLHGVMSTNMITDVLRKAANMSVRM